MFRQLDKNCTVSLSLDVKMLRDWLTLIDVKFNSPLMKKYQVLVFIFFFIFSNQRPLCNMVCLNQDPVNFQAFTDNSQRCSSLSVVLHVYAKDECHSWWQNSNFSEREITLIANDSLNIIFCTHILIAVYIKSGICAICKINCYTKTTKSCHILIYQKKIIWTHILSQPVSFQHHIY